MEASEIIELLSLEPHGVEGGFFRETYRGASTSIYYLITPESFSTLHRIRQDEVFHFYLGEPVVMLLIYPDGSQDLVTLGNDLAAGQQPQFVVPGGTWQGARLARGSFALFGTTVAPAFEFADLEIAVRETLLAQFPDLTDLITKYTL